MTTEHWIYIRLVFSLSATVIPVGIAGMLWPTRDTFARLLATLCSAVALTFFVFGLSVVVGLLEGPIIASYVTWRAVAFALLPAMMSGVTGSIFAYLVQYKRNGNDALADTD